MSKKILAGIIAAVLVCGIGLAALLISQSNRPPQIQGKFVVDQPFESLQPDILYYSQDDGLVRMKGEHYPNPDDYCNYLSFNPNDDSMIGVFYPQDLDTEMEQIAFIELSDKEVRPTTVLYTNLSDPPVTSPKVLPGDNNKISFRQGQFYYLFDLQTKQVSQIEIDYAYNVVWLDSHTLLYARMELPDLNSVEIRKFDIDTKQDSLYIANGYGCSLSSNRKFLAYGLSTDPSKIFIRNLETGSEKNVNIEPSTYTAKGYEAIENTPGIDAYKRVVVSYRDPETGKYVNTFTGEYDPYTTELRGQEDLCDGLLFQPSSDGEQLLFVSARTTGIILIDCADGTQTTISKKVHPFCLDWKTN
ncbi:hypothetical protein CLOSTMETH_03625 [[Clostridium] methylpentosum DSM 5476]|uniref:DUF5050 domain-containing protein n=1 Tax=[Clostridium] methylpentosum DSM 5476 TaxID=537013 RepID=C0EID0_9FIRM|nr:hypothetical protein CLOSTMETH_03625 [[Clostridium] methylpentosum DSM 5476]MDY3989111.1 hypothetical protein [Massilioclostridium sp.]MEE1491225.1 hypothetical protein [Massilioclostridium sp.]